MLEYQEKMKDPKDRMYLCFKATDPFQVMKKHQHQFQLFWFFSSSNLTLTSVLAIVQPSCLPAMFNNQDHLLQSNLATGAVMMASILVTGILFFFSIKSGLESTMVEPSKHRKNCKTALFNV